MHLQRHIINLDTRATHLSLSLSPSLLPSLSLSLESRSDCTSNLMARRSTSARIPDRELAFCKRVSYATVTPRYTARWLGGRGGGWRKRGCKCALLGRAVPGYFRNQDSTCARLVAVREAWKIRPIVCQFWILGMVYGVCSSPRPRPSATVADLVITIIKLCFPITGVISCFFLSISLSSPLSSFTWYN